MLLIGTKLDRELLSENSRVASLDKVIAGGRQGLATGSPDLEVAASDTTTIGPQPGQRDGISLAQSEGGRATNVASLGSGGLVSGVRVGPSAVSVIASPEVTEVVNKVARGRNGVRASLPRDEEAVEEKSSVARGEASAVGESKSLAAGGPVGGGEVQVLDGSTEFLRLALEERRREAAVDSIGVVGMGVFAISDAVGSNGCCHGKGGLCGGGCGSLGQSSSICRRGNSGCSAVRIMLVSFNLLRLDNILLTYPQPE